MDRAADDVAFGLENRAWPLEAMRTRVPTALSAVGLGGFGRRRGTRLSGGEQQRLALAGVEAPDPAVLVLDEPTSNLDPAGAAALFRRLVERRDERRTTIVLVEHRADLAWPLADMVLALDGAGAPIALDTPARLLARLRQRPPPRGGRGAGGGGGGGGGSSSSIKSGSRTPGGRSRRSATWTSTSGPASGSPSSGPTGPASRRCCGSSPASSARPRVRSSSAAPIRGASRRRSSPG